MDMQDLFDAISNASRNTRGQYQMTLGKAIKALDVLPGHAAIRFQDGQYPVAVDSYRGYYSDLSIEPGMSVKTVSELSDRLKAAVGQTFTGYKGGEFVMGEDTPLWTAPYGCTGPAIMDFMLVENVVIIVTKEID